MTSNIDKKSVEGGIPFDLYVHAALDDYDKISNIVENTNEDTNGYKTFTTFKNVCVSKKKQANDKLTKYIKINSETKAFLSNFTNAILDSARELYSVGPDFIYSIENTRLSEEEESYAKNTSRNDKDFAEARSYLLKIARIKKFSKIAGEQVTDSICSFVHKLVTTVEIDRNSTLANAKMQLDEEDMKEDIEAKFVAKLKNAMDNAVYSSNEMYRIIVIDTIFYFMKCVAFVINRFIWHKHTAQNPGLPTIIGVLASHGLHMQFIRDYSVVADKAEKKSKKDKSTASSE